MSSNIEAVVEKMHEIELTLSQTKGEISLFLLVEREEAPERWDVIIAASWGPDGLRDVVAEITKRLTTEELVLVSRVLTFATDEPWVTQFTTLFRVTNSRNTRIVNLRVGSVQIVSGYVIVSRGASAGDEPAHTK